MVDVVAIVAPVVAAILVPFAAVVKRIRDRSIRNQRQLQGDPDNPNAEGVLQISHDNRERLARLEQKMDSFRTEMQREHEAVMERLNELDDDDS